MGFCNRTSLQTIFLIMTNILPAQEAMKSSLSFALDETHPANSSPRADRTTAECKPSEDAATKDKKPVEGRVVQIADGELIVDIGLDAGLPKAARPRAWWRWGSCLMQVQWVLSMWQCQDKNSSGSVDCEPVHHGQGICHCLT